MLYSVWQGDRVMLRPTNLEPTAVEKIVHCNSQEKGACHSGGGVHRKVPGLALGIGKGGEHKQKPLS